MVYSLPSAAICLTWVHWGNRRRRRGNCCSPNALKPPTASKSSNSNRAFPGTPAWNGAGRRARRPRGDNCGIFSRATPAPITSDATSLPTAKRRLRCRRICISARSVRARSGGTPTPRKPATAATRSSANYAGATSAITCCITTRTSPTRIGNANSTNFPGAKTWNHCAAGGKAPPACRWSMRACANYGAQARCTTARAW